MPRVRLIAFWMVIGCACCFGDSLPIDPSASASADQSPIANQLFTLTQQQSVSGTADLLDTRPNLSFLRMRQLVELQRWSKRVQKAMRTLERGLQDPSVSRDQLMGFQRHVTKLVKSMDRRISKYLRQSANLDKVGASSKQIKQQVEHSSNELDPIDQQLSSTNNLKMIHGPNFFFSSSSSSSVSPPHFWRVDASASTIRPSSSNGSGSSFSTFTPSSDSLSSDSPSSSPPPSSNTSSSANSLDLSRSNTNHSSNSSSLYDNSFKIVTNSDKVDLSASEQHPSNRSLNVIERLSEIVNSTNAKLGETLDNARIKSKIDRFAGGFIGALNGLIASQDQTVNGEKQSFLLYHKCSEGYLQLADNGSLKTEIKSNLMGKSEFILHYLSKPNNHQLQIQAQDGRYVCFSAQGRPEVMASLNEPMCTFQIIYHKKEYIQLASVWNTAWTLAFNRKGIPIRARASQKRNNKRKTTSPNPCTLFVRQRSDEQLIARFGDLRDDQEGYRQRVRVHNAQIKQIEQSNNLLAQDSMIMAKIDRLRREKDGETD